MSRRACRRWRWVLLLAAAAGLSAAQAPAAGAVPLQTATLANGLRVVVSVDHSLPVYALAVAYDVGSRNERAGRSGFAHLFEHMMFQGSAHVGKGEHLLLVQGNGGSFNGTTNKDRTIFYETLPANQLALGLFLESDRMRSLAITQANLDNQRNAVQEERRQAFDNQPYGKTPETVDELAYDIPAYQHPTIGSMTDLNAATVADVAAFFHTYYAPNNAVLTLVGDFEPATALAMIRKYFGSIPRQPPPPPPDMDQPPQKAERRQTITDAFATAPRLDWAFRVPAGNTPDWYALSVMAGVIAGGRTAPLVHDLVETRAWASSLSASVPETRGPGLFRITAVARPGVDPLRLETALEADLARFASDPVSADEIARMVMPREAQLMRAETTVLGRAATLATDAVDYGDPNLINLRLAKYQAVTPADVLRVAALYFAPANRTVVITLPQSRAAEARSR